jgi:hypothetical protein
VYRGPEQKCTVMELAPRTEYWLRAAFVPADSPDPEDGPFCPPISFTTSAPEPPPSVPAADDVVDSSKEMASSSLQVCKVFLQKLYLIYLSSFYKSTKFCYI